MVAPAPKAARAAWLAPRAAPAPHPLARLVFARARTTHRPTRPPDVALVRRSQIDKEAADDDAQSDDEGGEEEDEEDAEAEEAADDEEEEAGDGFAETAMPLEPTGGVDGEELLCSRYLQTDVDEAQHEAAQLHSTMQNEDERRQMQLSSTRPSDMSARRRHHPEEPLQRPSTPRVTTDANTTDAPVEAPFDYGAHAMQQSGAQPPDPGETDAAAADGEGGEEGQDPTYQYPDPDAVDSSSPTIPVHNRLARTPSRKTRGEGSPAPLQPTAPRPRATVERTQRKPPQATPTAPPKGPAS